MFQVFCGEPITREDVQVFPAKISATGTKSSYSSFVPITVSDVPTTAMATRVSIGVSSGGKGTNIGAWQLTTPDGVTKGESAYYSPVEYTYSVNSNNNTKLSGVWNVRYKATRSTSVTVVPSIMITYTYEYGD